MNFQVIRQAEGQKDGQYQMKVSIFGTPTIVGEVTFTPKGKKIQQVTITDDKGESNKVKIFGGKMTTTFCGQRLAFEIAPYTSEQNQQTYYSGFWNDRAEVSPLPTSYAYGNPPQAPLQATQRPNVATEGQSTTKEDVNAKWEAQETREVRTDALKIATDLKIADIKPFGESGLLSTADLLVGYIYNGTVKTPDINTYEEAKAAHESRQQPEDDIPF